MWIERSNPKLTLTTWAYKPSLRCTLMSWDALSFVIDTGKVVLHNFMDSDDPIMKEFRKDGIISRTVVETATLAGIKFIKFTPGYGKKELGGHYDNLHVLPDPKDDYKSTPVSNNESSKGSVGNEQQVENSESSVGNEQQMEGESSDISDISESSDESGEDCEKVDDGKSGDMHIEVKRGSFFISCRSFLHLIFCVQL